MLNSENINRAGRKKGSKNKASESVRKSFQMLVEDNILQLQVDLDMMTPKERFDSIVNLAKFVLPTLRAVDVSTNPESSFKPIQIHFNSNDTD
jgi:hypothetical protein